MRNSPLLPADLQKDTDPELVTKTEQSTPSDQMNMGSLPSLAPGQLPPSTGMHQENRMPIQPSLLPWLILIKTYTHVTFRNLKSLQI